MLLLSWKMFLCRYAVINRSHLSKLQDLQAQWLVKTFSGTFDNWKLALTVQMVNIECFRFGLLLSRTLANNDSKSFQYFSEKSMDTQVYVYDYLYHCCKACFVVKLSCVSSCQPRRTVKTCSVSSPAVYTAV